MELWDGYNRDGSLAGVTLERGKPLPAGVYHAGVEILVRHTDGTYLMMQRDARKPSYPLMFETSMGGCVIKGEDMLTAAHRELKEETGLDETCFTLLVHNIDDPKQAIIDCFLCVTDKPKDSITLQDGETVSYKWVTEEELIRHINSEYAIKRQVARFSPYFKKLGFIR